MVNRQLFTMLGQSRAFAQVLDEARFLSGTDFNVLLAGESGVGKGLLAQVIHENSPRRQRKMLSLSCAGVEQSRLGTELFEAGLFETAHRSTLLLADVGEMGPPMQARLLRFLENGKIPPVGWDRGNEMMDVRIISATSRDLLQGPSPQAFCVDLYYRLNVAHLQIPPLRECRDDISFLVRNSLKILSDHFRLPLCELDPSALSALEGYAWPGNISELRAVAELLARRHAGRVVSVDQLPEIVLGQGQPVASTVPAAVDSADAETVATMCYERITQGRESFWAVVGGPMLAPKATPGAMAALITRGLRQTNGSFHALATLFHLPPSDHKRFFLFLQQHNCPRPRALRAAIDDVVRVTPVSLRTSGPLRPATGLSIPSSRRASARARA